MPHTHKTEVVVVKLPVADDGAVVGRAPMLVSITIGGDRSRLMHHYTMRLCSPGEDRHNDFSSLVDGKAAGR